MWKAPKSKNPQDPFALGIFDENLAGRGRLQFVGDAYGDGGIELLVSRSFSDTRPTSYRIFRWDGKAFAPVSEKLLIEKPRGSGKFVWIANNQIKSVKEISTWVCFLESVGGTLQARITDFKGGHKKSPDDPHGTRNGS